MKLLRFIYEITIHKCITLKSFGNKSVILEHAYSGIFSLVTDMKPEAKEKLTTTRHVIFHSTNIFP